MQASTLSTSDQEMLKTYRSVTRSDAVPQNMTIGAALTICKPIIPGNKFVYCLQANNDSKVDYNEGGSSCTPTLSRHHNPEVVLCMWFRHKEEYYCLTLLTCCLSSC